MATVVVIHAADDTLPARALAEKLRGAKLSVILERPPGEELREAVKDASVTIALWSPRSVSQQPLIDEVVFARGKSKVVHACMQSAPAPDQFRSDQSVNLTGWRGEDDFAPWRELANIVTKKAGVAPLPPPAPRPPSGFFQPGRVDASGAPPQGQQRQAGRPQQQQQQRQQQQQQRPQPAQQQRQAAPRQAPQAHAPIEPKSGGGGRGMLIGIIAFVVVALAGGGGYWFFTQGQAAQTTSLEDVDLGSASAIREFLANDPPAAAREQAEQALATLEQQSFDAARDANTIEAFETFLRDFPESEEAIFVQGQIQQLRLIEADPAQAVPPEGAVPPEATAPAADPDLVPPNTTPEASGANGPAVITPPASEPATQEPGDAPTN